jgi:hypothetical protein
MKINNKHFLNILFLVCFIALGHTAYGLFNLTFLTKEYCIYEPRAYILLPEFIIFGLGFVFACVIAYFILFRKGYSLELKKKV